MAVETMTVHELVSLMRDAGHIGFSDKPEEFLQEHPDIQIVWAHQQAPVFHQYLQMSYDTLAELDRMIKSIPQPVFYQVRSGFLQQIDRLERCQAGIFMFIRGRIGFPLN